MSVFSSCLSPSASYLSPVTHLSSPTTPKAHFWFLLSCFTSTCLIATQSLAVEAKAASMCHAFAVCIWGFWVWIFSLYQMTKKWTAFTFRMEKENNILTSIHFAQLIVSSPTIIISFHLFQLWDQSSAWTQSLQHPTLTESCLFKIPGVINAWNKLLYQIAVNCVSMQSVCSEWEGERWLGGGWWLRLLVEILFSDRKQWNSSLKTWQRTTCVFLDIH